MTETRSFTGTGDYIASPELREIVNVAIQLGRPLLIRGEPGTGKTLLAQAVAESLRLPLINWHVKSTSKAQDGLYVYDTVQRLNDSRFGTGNVEDIEHYIKLGPLGSAFASAKPSIVLIDEIDKADVEFPNDLLHELDAMNFTIPETGRKVEASIRPTIIITSNAEKELPDAFLRRCIFHYINFPAAELMMEIIKVHFPKIEENLVNQCLQRFYWLREQPEINKKPSTSELLDWIAALIKGGIKPESLSKTIPFLGTLIKKESDIKLFYPRKQSSSFRF